MTSPYMQRATNAELALLVDRGHGPAIAEAKRRGLDCSPAATQRRETARRATVDAYFANATPEQRAMRERFAILAAK